LPYSRTAPEHPLLREGQNSHQGLYPDMDRIEPLLEKARRFENRIPAEKTQDEARVIDYLLHNPLPSNLTRRIPIKPSQANVPTNILTAIANRMTLPVKRSDRHTGTAPFIGNYNGKVVDYGWFYNQVASYKPWDYKLTNPALYEDFGNFHYGVVGAAHGFTLDALLWSAGLAQVKGDRSQPEYDHPFIGGHLPYGDEPWDQEQIIQGYFWYMDLIGYSHANE
jgi:hypothetical protein